MTMWQNKYRLQAANQRPVFMSRDQLWPMRGQYSGHPSQSDHWAGHWNSRSVDDPFLHIFTVLGPCQKNVKLWIKSTFSLIYWWHLGSENNKCNVYTAESVLRINNSNTQTLLSSYLLSLTVMSGVPISRCYAGTRTNECMFSSQVSKYGPQPSPVCQNNPAGNN